MKKKRLENNPEIQKLLKENLQSKKKITMRVTLTCFAFQLCLQK